MLFLLLLRVCCGSVLAKLLLPLPPWMCHGSKYRHRLAWGRALLRGVEKGFAMLEAALDRDSTGFLQGGIHGTVKYYAGHRSQTEWQSKHGWRRWHITKVARAPAERSIGRQTSEGVPYLRPEERVCRHGPNGLFERGRGYRWPYYLV